MATESSESLIVLCPGQGAQSVGMGQAWAQASDVAKQTFAQADEILGFELSRHCFEGPAEQLNRTDVAQAAIYTTSVACYRALVDRCEMDPTRITATAGLSLGEFTALHLAGAFSFEDGLKLVRLRGQAMQAAAEAQASSMVAITGEVDESKVNELCERARGESVLVPANFNSPIQVVVSGSVDACERAAAVAGEMGLKATPLSVAGAFHSPIMQPAADRLAEALASVDWHKPRLPVVSNVTATPHDVDDVASIRRRLVEQLTNPVRWSQSMRWMLDQMSGTYVELAPGKVLSGLMRRIDRSVRVKSFDSP